MIYVLVPAYNEAPTIGVLLWKIRQVFTAFSREYQLLVVNDGSTDGTDDVLPPYLRALPLTLVTHRERQGYARSLEELLRLAVARTDRPRRDLAVTIQADFSDSPDDIPELVRRVEGGTDVVTADSRAGTAMPRAAAIARRLLPSLVPRALRLPEVGDYVGTLRAYRLETLARLLKEAGSGPVLTRDGWAADLELLVRAARHARRLESVAVSGGSALGRRKSRATAMRSALGAWRAARHLGSLARTLAEPPAAEDGSRRHRRGRGRGRGGRGRGPSLSRPEPSSSSPA